MFKRVRNRIRKEVAMRDNIKSGFSRRAASQWYNKERKDSRLWRKVYSAEVLNDVHQRGFLAKNIDTLHLLENKDCQRISDRDYFYLQPMNSSFSKWIEDMNTMSRMLPKHGDKFTKMYYSMIRRGETLILQYPCAKEPCTEDDIVALLKEKNELLIRPTFWGSKAKWFKLACSCDERCLYVNDKPMLIEDFCKMVSKLSANYMVCDTIDYGYPLCEGWDMQSYLKFYIANDPEKGAQILCAVVEVIPNGKTYGQQYYMNLQTGSFTYVSKNEPEVDEDEEEEEQIEASAVVEDDAWLEEKVITIPGWDKIKSDLVALSNDMPQISFFSISVVLDENGFKITNCSPNPYLPRLEYSEEMAELNAYLKKRLEIKRAQVITPEERKLAIKNSMFAKFVKRFCKPGIRPYMQRLWFDTMKSDLKYKDTTLKQKIWAWKRGFPSYRIQQYGLTEENYKNFLSDYQYHWLNRINNLFQKWVNDKTSFRAVMTPFKEYIPDYYFSVYKENNEMRVVRMQDCPDGVPADYTGVCQLLREQGKLVFKPSAGTHGDGFYCLEHNDDGYFVNGEATTEEGINELMKSQKSFYIVTSYIWMHPDLKKIYPQSVNSIRIMVINREGYNPKIMQTYMRIGSSKTGYTDNVGYGGICAMIDMETGVLYDPETLRDHVYYPCPQHPDTGTEIAGIRVPHWDLVRQKVVEICQMMPELEYLGFDVAVTEDAFNVMEINIHQDLHKVALHTDEIRQFYVDKIAYKSRLSKKKVTW